MQYTNMDYNKSNDKAMKAVDSIALQIKAQLKADQKKKEQEIK